MRINPRTITVSEHHLRYALEALKNKLAKLTPGSKAHEMLENTYFSMVDAFNASNPGERWEV